MKIGIFDPYLDDLGGGEKYMMTIAQDLSKNHEVEVFWDSSEDLDRIKERFGLDFSKVKLTRNIFSHESFFPRLLATRKYDALIFLSDGSIPLSLSRKLFIHVQQPLPFRPIRTALSPLSKEKFTSLKSESPESNIYSIFLINNFAINSKNLNSNNVLIMIQKIMQATKAL
jgi:hypothetical protein